MRPVVRPSLLRLLEEEAGSGSEQETLAEEDLADEQVPPFEIEGWKHMFSIIDANHDGHITASEMTTHLSYFTSHGLEGDSPRSARRPLQKFGQREEPQK